MTKRLTMLTICTLLLSMGHVCAENPCPCQTNQATSANSEESQQEKPSKAAPTDSITVCPCYPYAFYPGYCSWYAMQCGGSPVSINLSCDHGSGACSNPPVNCEALLTKSIRPTATDERQVQLTEKLSCNELDRRIAGFAVRQKSEFFKITYQPGSGDPLTIYARVDHVKVPPIRKANNQGTFPVGTLFNGHEVFPDLDPTGCGPFEELKTIEIVGNYQFRFQLKVGNEQVWVYVVTYTKLN